MDKVRFKSRPINVPEKAPFEDDLLGRKDNALVLTDLVKNLNEPFVLSIDSPWGTGKTTFLRMWLQHLKNEGIPCLYFNAWETDFSNEPLVSLMGEIGGLIESVQMPEKRQLLAREYFEKAKKTGIQVIRAAIPVALKIATQGVLDIGEKSKEAISDVIEDLAKEKVERYVSDKKTIAEFRTNLRLLVEILGGKNASGEALPLVFIIDELDRCKPTYAVELLERVKHLFTVDGLVFVLSTDRKQLGACIKGLYGEIDDDAYLRRFFDLEYRLPEPDYGKFAEALFQRFSLDAILDAKQGDTIQDSRYIRKFFPEFLKLFGFSMRVQEQCFTQLAIVLKTTPANNYLYGTLLAALICLRAKNKELYFSYCQGRSKPEDVMNFIASLQGGKKFNDSNSGCVLEAHLVKGIANREEKELYFQKYSELAKLEGVGAHRNRRIADLISNIGLATESMTLYLFKRVEFSHRFIQDDESVK